MPLKFFLLPLTSLIPEADKKDPLVDNFFKKNKILIPFRIKNVGRCSQKCVEQNSLM